MKKTLLAIIAVVLVLFMGSCASSKKVAYFQNIDTLNLASSRGLYDARIMPKDMLTITVSTTDPQAAVPFNLVVGNAVSTTGAMSSGGGNLQGYLVENDGTIQFPVVGKVKVAGLTKSECQETLKQKIMPYMAQTENPVVTVRMSSYRITVLGVGPGRRPHHLWQARQRAAHTRGC